MSFSNFLIKSKDPLPLCEAACHPSSSLDKCHVAHQSVSHLLIELYWSQLVSQAEFKHPPAYIGHLLGFHRQQCNMFNFL